MSEYTKEQLWKIYENIPKELKEAIFSVETADNIHSICLKVGVKEENNSKIAELIGDVLLGILPPEELQKTIENELKINENSAKKINQMIGRIIFLPVKPALDKLYEKEENATEEKTKKPMIKKIEKKSVIGDKYQEPIE